MNILPKKSWHVRTKKNIERVRRDEEKAAEEEKERLRRIALAEQESRTELLRERSKSKKRPHDQLEDSFSPLAIQSATEPSSSKLAKPSKDISLSQGGHINFFKDIEEGIQRDGKNKEHEAEKAAEKEKWEKNIGLLTYLGQSSIESQNETPWYLHKKTEKSECKTSSIYEPKLMERADRDQKLKNSIDPLKDMRRHLEKHHKHQKSGKSKEKSGIKSKSKVEKIPTVSTSPSSQTKTIEQLRAERLRREMAEKQKIATVMAKARGESAQDKPAEVISDLDRERIRGYNSRYNPEFARPMSRNKR